MQNDLNDLDADRLRERFAELVLLHDETQHIGRQNRISGWLRDIADRLIAVGGGSERELLPLLQHSSGTVRLAAAERVRPFDRDLFVATLESLAPTSGQLGRKAQFRLESFKRREEWAALPSEPQPVPDPNWLRILHWQENNPPPTAMSREQFEVRVAGDFSPERATQILALARPAIGLWPQRQRSADAPASSRLGGEVWAPAGWQWPTWEAEPMYFLGQIRCRELAGLPGAEYLPGEGMLAFFGDHDVISGSFPSGDPGQGAVCHWPETGLVPTDPPLPLDTSASATTPLVFRPFIDLPHRFSTIIEELELSPEEELEQYDRLRDDSRRHGIPADVANHVDNDSKLLGWPDLVQNDFGLPLVGAGAFRLLAQLPARMGPGGSVYFFIRDADLAEHRFDRAVLEEQST